MVMVRNPDCHVVISGTAVSRAHAHIIRTKGSFFLEDLGSRNKTFINNQEITPRKEVLLRDNDRIKICDFLCVFHDESRKPLPPEMRPEEPEPIDEPQGSTTVEVALTGLGSHDLLETQPAEKLKTLLDITTNLSKVLALDSLWPRIVDSLFLLFN